MLLVNGEKMSKSLGNFVTIRDALKTANGEILRLLLIRSHYRSTLDYTDAALDEARRELDRFYRALEKHRDVPAAARAPDTVLEPLLDDLNTPGAIAVLHELSGAALAGDPAGGGGPEGGGATSGPFRQNLRRVASRRLSIVRAQTILPIKESPRA